MIPVLECIPTPAQYKHTQLLQDLPNYAQHMVPIHSLGQEWLWCETWCGQASRPRAKTIDLCNNPLTKEPKLQSARRIIAEWPALDREAREFTQAVRAVGWLEWMDNCVCRIALRDKFRKFVSDTIISTSNIAAGHGDTGRSGARPGTDAERLALSGGAAAHGRRRGGRAWRRARRLGALISQRQMRARWR